MAAEVRNPGERFFKLGAGALLAVPALAFSLVSSESFRFPKLWLGQGLVFLLILAGLRRIKAPEPAALAWGIGVATAGLAMVNTDHVLTGSQELCRLLALAGAFYIFRQVRRPERLWPIIMAAGALNCAMAFAQAAGWRPEWWVPWQGRHAIYGTFGNPNFLAEYLTPLALLAGGHYLAAGTRLRAGLNLGACAVFLACLLLTVSRSAWLGLGAGLAVAVLMQGRMLFGPAMRGKLAVLVLIFLALTGAFWRPLWTRIESSSPKGDPGLTTRLFMWRAAAGMFKESPWLGAGPGGYGLRYLERAGIMHETGTARPAYAGITAEAHNDALQLLAERGLLGAAAWLLAFSIILANGLRGDGTAINRSAIWGAVAALLCEGMFGFPFRIMPTAILFLWLLACLTPESNSVRGAPKALRAALAVLVLPAGWLTARSFLADAELARGKRAAAGEPWLRRGLALLPGHGELHFRLGHDLLRRGRLKEARDEFIAAQAGFKDPDTYFNLGFIALKRERYPEAVDWYRNGLRLYPFYRARPYAELAEALLGMGERREAARVAARALEIDPGMTQARRVLMRAAE